MRLAHNFSLPEEALLPRCYAELLGYAHLGITKRNHLKGRGSGSWSHLLLTAQTMGAASSSPGSVQCYYRGLYSNWRAHDSTESFWPVVVFCPFVGDDGDTECERFDDIYSLKDVSHDISSSSSSSGAPAAAVAAAALQQQQEWCRCIWSCIRIRRSGKSPSRRTETATQSPPTSWW